MKNNNGKIILKIFLIILILIILIGACIAGYAYYYLNSRLDKIQYTYISANEIEINPEVEQNLEEYRNILIFGLDAREDRFSNSRSDCIIIASVNMKTKEISLTSVYRDCYLDINGSLDKITHAYAYGGAVLAMNSLNKNLDLNVKEFVTVNFDSVVAAIDAIGGIEMKLNSDEVKYINKYIRAVNTQMGRNSKEITSAGTYTLDGVQALAYGRIRYTEGGDYKRTERMRDVAIAAFEKGKTKSVSEILELFDLLLPHVYTNINKDEIISMIPQAFSYKVTNSIGWPYEKRGITLDRWYGVPVTLEENVTRLHQEVFKEEDYVPSDTVKEISKRIVNKTGYSK